jgi:peptide/nickel transport system ATP-binding protein
MRQRAMIAMALALDPAVLIADEPTTALDVTVQAQVLDLVERLQEEFGTAIVVITHDLGVVADMADDVLVMYAGRPVEVADRRTTYYGPHMPYTWGLLQSLPPVAAEHTGEQLRPIRGQPPSLINLPKGCSFNPRCPYVMEVCTKVEPELLPADSEVPSHLSACHLSLEDKERIWQQEVAPTR